ncbi:hypothetical protein Tco_0295867 [Tanacetum coccineum]
MAVLVAQALPACGGDGGFYGVASVVVVVMGYVEGGDGAGSGGGALLLLRRRSFDVITEYLVNISKRRAFWILNKDILKITILKNNTPYPSRKIRSIHACTHQRPQRKEDQYAISSEDQYAVLDI